MIWLAMQLAALGVCAARVPLWARAPMAMERSALVVMLAVQVGMSALIFPHLLGTLAGTILVIASAGTLAVLASFLADASPLLAMRGELYVMIWLTSLHVWNRQLIGSAAKMFAAAIAGTFVLGGPVLWYLHAEFSGSSPLNIESLARFGPMGGAISQTFEPFSYGGWLELGLIFCCGATAEAFRSLLLHRSRQVIH
jgi:hypothetical protein